MRKAVSTFVLTALGAYLVLHLVLGSSPIQRRVLAEVRAELARYGLDLEIESIEFSAFAPRIYLNRVKLSARPQSEIPLPEPLGIDKIKLEFQPLALLSRRIVFEEITLFHPRLVHPSVDRLVHKIQALVAAAGKRKGKPGKEPGSGSFELVVRKAGVVDALIQVAGQDPSGTLRTRSLTAFVISNIANQRSLTLEIRGLEVKRGGSTVVLDGVQLDLDLARKSLRVNRLMLSGEKILVSLKGVSAIPEKGATLPSSMNVSYELHVPLKVLSGVAELKLPSLDGSVDLAGTARLQSGEWSGQAGLKYLGVAVDGYRIGSGEFDIELAGRRAKLVQTSLKFGGGELRSNGIEIGLTAGFPISGDLTAKDLKLEEILASVKEEDLGVFLGASGPIKVTGSLWPLGLNADIDAAVSGLLVLAHPERPPDPENTVISVPTAQAKGRLTFTSERMGVSGAVDVLGGRAKLDGFLGFAGAETQIHVEAKGLSLTSLGTIAEIPFKGELDAVAEIERRDHEGRVSAKFSSRGAEVADVLLGEVDGKLQYQKDLLSFDELSLPAIEPVKGEGFVDFRPPVTHYRFQVEAGRVAVNQVFASLQKLKLGFPVATGGEAQFRLVIEGGHDELGIDVGISGTGRGFTFFDESWNTGSYTLRYRPAGTDILRVVLMKRTGGVEVRGRAAENEVKLVLGARDLRIEELDRVGKAPFAGLAIGDVELAWRRGVLVSAVGEIALGRPFFRGKELPEATFRFSPSENGIETLASIGGQGLKVRLLRFPEKPGSGEVLAYALKQDVLPYVVAWLGKDLPGVSDLTVSGEMVLKGDPWNWSTLTGSGTLSSLSLGLTGTPMINREEIRFRVSEDSIVVDPFLLSGQDSQLALEFSGKRGGKVAGKLDGKLDLRFVQPLIPGLDYGTGTLTVGARVGGRLDAPQLLGNVALSDGVLRLAGLGDEMRGVKAQLTVSQDRIAVDRFDCKVNGGDVRVGGGVRLAGFRSFEPKLQIAADGVTMSFQKALAMKFSGEFTLSGPKAPYLLGGKCRVLESTLTSFAVGSPPIAGIQPPVLTFDVRCEARDRIFVKTDLMDAEWKGTLHLLGDSNKLGLHGSVESMGGVLLFRETRFSLNSGNVRFESPAKIAPRFNVSARAMVREAKNDPQAQEYEVNLLSFGTPDDYRIRLTSSPALPESDIISLLLLGVTGRSQDGNFLDLGSALAGQIPLQSKLQSELGFDVKISAKPQASGTASTTSTGAPSTGVGGDITVPSVTIQKEITKRTKLSYSNTIEATPVRELKIEHLLDDNLTINATATGNPRGSSSTSGGQAYGVDFRYRFSFE